MDPIRWTQVTLQAEIEGVETIKAILLRRGFGEVLVTRTFNEQGMRWFEAQTFFVQDDGQKEHRQKLEEDLWHLRAFNLCAISELQTETVLTLPDRDQRQYLSDVCYVTDKVAVIAADYHGKLPAIKIPIFQHLSDAFGTGLHPSTVLAMLALEKHLELGQTVMDVGTGTGILAFAAAKMGASQVDAIDLSPEAIAEAKRNLTLNCTLAVPLDIRFWRATAAELVGQYDLVVANIPFPSLMRSANHLTKAVLPQGKLILSGFLAQEKIEITNTYQAFSLEKIDEIDDNQWITQIFIKR